jgi:two-component system response regulator AtoC
VSSRLHGCFIRSRRVLACAAMSEGSSIDLELVLLMGEELRIFELGSGGEVSLGRDAANRIQIEHPSVSRRHALLNLGPPLLIEDLRSANGTFVHSPASPGGAGGTERLQRLGTERAALAVGEPMLLGAVSAVVRHRRAAPTEDAIVRDPNLQAVYAQAERAAASTISVLLLGETGVGKEVLARFIHAQSLRATRPFVGINCAAFSEALLEGELFGYEKGAFTGALQARPGLFEAADGGTFFLDEVGELALPTQAKFLRVLEERSVLRLGARTPRPVDARFIAATNRDLEAEVGAGRFRQDLLYRLNSLSLTIPPLRERSGELESLARSFVHAACRQLERAPLDLSPEALSLLHAHRWPGNVRELRNAMDRAVVLCTGRSIGPEYLPASVTAGVSTRPSAAVVGLIADLDPERFHAQVESLQRARIVEALAKCGGNQTQAAKLLGVARRTLVSQLVELGIPRPRARGTLR